MDREDTRKWFTHTADLVIEHVDRPDGRVQIYFLSSMADSKIVYNELMPKLRLLCLDEAGIEHVEKQLGTAGGNRIFRETDAISRLLSGDIYIHVEGADYGVTVPSEDTVGRSVQSAEIETVVLGPQLAFVEEIQVNLCILRKYLPSSLLFHERLLVGELIPTEVSILYLDGIADPENVNTIRQRLQDIRAESDMDAGILAQYLADNEMSIFPTLQLTERPDRAVQGLRHGQIVVIAQGSPFVILGPTTFLRFFQSPDDYYLRWNLASFNRVMRIIAMFISLLLTPIYVATLTFHYEMIPADLLLSLAQSRSRVPFPPLWEAIFMELIIELLREAGARLPTKVGQTIGIVGGIVIGQATVQAGFTSNILIIIVALGALSSFIAPSYMISSTIRVIRFPMILLSGLLGAVGIVAGFSFLASHLLRQKSLGRPYMYPVFPVRFSDWKNSLIRAPLSLLPRRLMFFTPKQKMRFDPERGRQKEDID